MSESSKMGLFGSKDKTNETKKEGTKEDSPDRYAPYCIDSDSETYDTEALSMMDINDIIGVQSEPVSESTLESEIAALTQIITESKGDGSQSITETKHETLEEDDLSIDQQLMGVGSIEAIRESNTNDRFKSTLEELESVCGSSQMSVCDIEQLTVEKAQSSNKSSVLDDLKLNVTSSSINPNLEDNCEPDVLTKSLSTTVVNKMVDKDSIAVIKSDTEETQTVSSAPSKISENVRIEEIVNRLNIEQIDNGNIEMSSAKFEVKAVENISSISGSLQLIGEAYTSEDSQESNSNDVEPTEATPTISFNKNPLASRIEEEEGMKEIREEICEPQDNVDDQGTCNIGSIERCMKEEILTTVEHSPEMCTGKVPATVEHSVETSMNEISVTVEQSAEMCTNKVPVTVEQPAETCTNEVPTAVEHSAEACRNEVHETVEPSAEICPNEVFATVEHTAETCANEVLATVKHSTETGTNKAPATVEHSPEMCTNKVPTAVEHSTETCTNEVHETVEHLTEMCTHEVSATVEHSQETCTNQSIPITSDDQIQDREVDTTVVCVEDKITEELPCGLENIKDIAIVDCKDHTALSDEKDEYDETHTIVADMEIIKESQQCEEKINDKVIMEEDKTIEETKVDSEIADTPVKECVPDVEECESKRMEEDTVEECESKKMEEDTVEEYESIDTINKELIGEVTESNILETADDRSNDDQLHNTESIDKMDAESKTEENEEKNNCIQKIKSLLEVKTIEHTSMDEIEKLEPVDIIDDCNIVGNASNLLESLQTDREMSTKELETQKEIQHDPVQSSTTQLLPDVTESVDAEENTTLTEKNEFELSMQTEDLCNNAVTSITDTVTEVDRKMEVEEVNLNTTVPEVDTKEHESIDPSIELSIDQTRVEGELETCASVNSTTISKDEVLSEDENDTSILNVPMSASELDPSLSIPTLADTSVLKNETQEMADSVEKNDETVEREMEEVCNIETLKSEDCAIKELDGELNRSKVTTMQEPVSITTDVTNITDSVEVDVQKDLEVSQKYEDVDLFEEKESNANEEIDDVPITTLSIPMDQEESTEVSVSNRNVILQDYEDIIIKESEIDEKDNIETADDIDNKCDIDETGDIDKDENEKEHILAEESISIMAQSKMDMDLNEDIDSVDEKEVADPKLLDMNTFSPPFGKADIMVPEEDTEEEGIEEEMNLTLDPEESDLQAEANEIDKDNSIETVEKVETSETMNEMNTEMETSTMMKIEGNEPESSDVEKPIEIIDTIPTLPNNEEKLEEKQGLEDNLKNEESSDIKGILEPTNDVVDIFSDEQCQNTQDIVTSILDDVRSATDFKNILGTEAGVASEIEQVLQQSTDLPLVDAEIEELAEKLPEEDILNKDMEDSMSAQNIDSLEELLDLDLIPEEEDPTLKIAQTEDGTNEQENLSKDVDMSLLLANSNRAPDISQASDYITNVIGSCLTNENDVSLVDTTGKISTIQTIDDKSEQAESGEIVKINENLMTCSIDKDSSVLDIEKDLEVDTDLPENELDMDFEGNPLESVDDLEDAESKLELAPDILLPSVDQRENLIDTPSGMESSQPSSEISELESAVKFLQESEEQTIDSPLVLSPKMVESDVDDIPKQGHTSSLFVPDDDMCEDASELVAELQGITTDSISISEAEIISEAAKLESEKKLAEQVKIDASMRKFEKNDIKLNVIEEKSVVSKAHENIQLDALENIEVQQAANIETEKKMSEAMSNLSKNVFKPSEAIPKTSILEERLKEPPKIEIPTTDITKITMSPTTSKDSLLIQKDSKMMIYQRMLESPKMTEKSEPRITDTPRKDSEKHDFENVGSPRIILKIAKSAIADCGEPRSPKSPKIRSAANSPNPEDSPGQKLGKIKLKLSKSGHPSIISNENVEEIGQWHSEGGSSLSPLGMKIKFSKSGDASIVSSDKFESADDTKDSKHKFEETKRTESPIGMKIKLLKTGDASIVQQDSKEMQIKHKDKLDIVQGSPKRTESPIGMKIKLSKSGDASIIQPERQDFAEEYRESTLKTKDASYNSPKRTESPIGMKFKLSKSGDASIVSPDISDEGKEVGRLKEKLEASPEVPKRTESPIGMKIKLTKTKGGASIISVENTEDAKDKLEIPDVPKRTESPLGMKIKLSKSGDASIVHSEIPEEIKDTKQKEKSDVKEKVNTIQDGAKLLDTSSGIKIKLTKSGETSAIVQETAEESEVTQETPQKVESLIGMKIKLSKFGDASIVAAEKQEQMEEYKSRESPQHTPKRTESPIGMKIKLSKTGDASIIQTEGSEDTNKIRPADAEHSKTTDAGLGMKIKLLKTGDASIVDPEKKDKQPRRRDTESPLEMKIKLSKTGHPTIVACDTHGEVPYKSKDSPDSSHNFAQRCKEAMMHKEPALKILKTGHSTILQSNRSELTIEPVQMQSKKPENAIEISPKRKEITISPVETKKSKLETQLSQILPEVTIQPVMTRDQKHLVFDPKTSSISLQQMNVISQEISITQVRPSKAPDTSMSEKLKDILSKNISGSPMSSDCEIIEHRPELIIVNENSNSSQDVMIIEEVPPNRLPEVKVPKKRGRPRRNPIPQAISRPPPQLLMSRDPLCLDQQPQAMQFEHRENERPKRTCRSQKSYAPPKRGRGRGRGKRKLDNVDLQLAKKPRLEQDLSAIEASIMAVITLDESSAQQGTLGKSPELYKALKQPPMDSKTLLEKLEKGQKSGEILPTNVPESSIAIQTEPATVLSVHGESSNMMLKPPLALLESKDIIKDKKPIEIIPEKLQRTPQKPGAETGDKGTESAKSENKDMLVPPGHPNWLTPTSKRQGESSSRQENISTVQVIDEETRMSAESGSRSQTPARNISAPASETIVNEESQGSVLSTATTESEKVKVKNRRMEINFDPDEGPFTVDKIAEYEWPLDRKGETFMIQEQISQYLGVKSFKRKYPDLKRRVVDMEERNYLRENGLVSEAMCDMGLTAVCSSEVLDVMCGDFPDQYEEYRKHMRERQVKEHSKKQKELTAAANAEKNRIDLAEMAVQSALSWNVSLNKARNETRKCSLDLQTFTIHVPKKQQKVEAERRVSHYPVALIPGQYTDYYREYTAAELRYYPLNTVLYGPMRPNERKFDSQSEGSQSDSDSDSSSDDSSSSSSEGTQDTEGSQSTMDDVDMEVVTQKDEIKLKCKMCLKPLNKHSKNEILIQCGTCNGNVHPSCIDLTLDMVPHIQSYAWQCTDCKTCAQCHDPADEDKMLFCDMCDRGYHIYCVGLRRVPQGRWHCQECAGCANCGSREPGGINSDRNSVAQWQHEYKKGDRNTRVYVSTLCVPCSKLWRKGRYCPHCSRCHTAPRLDLEANLVHCSACDKYLHLGCVETKGLAFDRKNYLCDFCTPNRQQVMKPLVSKIFKT